ncbi:oligosaccharyl transferase, archaeosortase A system-associated [Chloroflexota bacterium]
MSKVRPKLIGSSIVALCFGVALFFRVFLPYDKVFSGGWIKFTGADAYYHMRLVDNLVHNFPHLNVFDPYLLYPGGAEVSSIHFFDRLLASIIWVIGLGLPSQHTIDVISVYYPAVLGALTVIPVYFIGKELFGRWAGAIAAGLIALLPGEFLGRSILGFTDYHVAETLFTAVTMLFLILAIKTANQRGLTFGHIKRRDWATSATPVIYSLLAGVFMGIYLLTWAGGLLFVFIISVYFVIQAINDHLRHKSTDYICLVGVIVFLVAGLMFFWASHAPLYLASVVIALLIPLVLSSVSWLIARKKMRPVYYPLTLIGLGLVGLAIFYIVEPSLLRLMLDRFTVFNPAGAQLTTIEMQPFLFPQGTFTTAIAWGNFTTGFFLSFISLFIILIYFVLKQGNAEKSLLLVWSLVILAATLGQRRFAYYFAVNVAILTSYLSVLIYYILRFIIDYIRGVGTDYMPWRILELPDLEELIAHPVRISVRAERKRAERVERKRAKRLERGKDSSEEGGLRITARHVTMVLGAIAIFFLVFFPNIQPARVTASQARFAPSDAWVSSLSWLEENTPDPFGDPDFYYQLEENDKYRSMYWLEEYVPNPSGDPDFYYQLEESYHYPESAYGVMAWWDYGYWITRIAHRIPNANPSQHPGAIINVASFFSSQDENSANEIRQEVGASYIIVDFETATSKFYAVAIWAGKEQTDFFDVYLVPDEENRLVARLLYHPEYYRSLSTRLYNFDGKAVTPESTIVISYEERTDLDKEGTLYKVITSATDNFTSYQEAEAYLLSQESTNSEIVSIDPFNSPVPLEALEHYQLIHGSDEAVRYSETGMVPAVKIFEYID